MTVRTPLFPQNARLYGIVDLGYVRSVAAAGMAARLCEGGVDLLQLRAKGTTKMEVARLAGEILPVTREWGVPLVINDHADVAAAVGSEGVHVGQDDAAVARAREVVGDGCFVGKSTHSVAQAEAAQAEGADYIGFGPLYATGTKPDYVPIGLTDIEEVHRKVSVPIFCIGGVNAVRLPDIVGAGAKRVVVVSAFLLAKDVVNEVKVLRAQLLAANQPPARLGP
jgi:thiamine-phosphate pyrophosphorylase